MKIQINHIGKMEGKADFVAEILKGDVKSAKIITTEGARLIEGILVGRHFSEAPIITSRICGICPVVHKLSSIKAIENAFKIMPTPQTIRLRQVLELAQIIHSHALHLFFLSLPDFFGLENDLDFVKKYSQETQCAIKVRAWALKIIETIGGRAVHPINCEVGGFKVLPSKNELKNLQGQYEAVLKNALCLVNLVIKIKYPKLKRETKFICLTNKDEYAIYDGDIKISGQGADKEKVISAKNFTKNVKEIEEPYRAAKSATLGGKPFMVGALARLNNNHQQLNPLAKGILKGLRWKFPQYNSFENITAQAVEIVHSIEEINKILRDLDQNLKSEKNPAEKLKIIGAANPLGHDVVGIDAIEAPRGTLYHHYIIDKNGYIKSCNIITPTVSYLKNLEEDIKEYLPNIIKLSEKKRSLKIRALIRAYDPCIACATH
ncbi:MAG: Ni/Fe hydrogenase subunit alpha [Patescibacteria group bacterium]